MPLALYLFYFHGLSNYSINVDLNDLIKSSKKFSRVKSNLNLSWNSKSKKHLKKRWKIERNWKGGKRIKWFCFPLGYFFLRNLIFLFIAFAMAFVVINPSTCALYTQSMNVGITCHFNIIVKFLSLHNSLTIALDWVRDEILTCTKKRKGIRMRCQNTQAHMLKCDEILFFQGRFASD